MHVAISENAASIFRTKMPGQLLHSSSNLGLPQTAHFKKCPNEAFLLQRTAAPNAAAFSTAVIKRHNLFVFKLLFIFKFKEFQIGHKQKYYLSLNFQSTWLLWF